MCLFTKGGAVPKKSLVAPQSSCLPDLRGGASSRAAVAQAYCWDAGRALPTRASSDGPRRWRTSPIIFSTRSLSGWRDVSGNLQPQAARKDPQGPRVSTPRRPRACRAVREPNAHGEPVIRIQTARVTAPTRARLAAQRRSRDAPLRRGRWHQVQAQTGGLQIFLTAAPSARLEPEAAASVVQTRPCVSGVRSAARGRGMGAHSRSLLLLLAAPLVVQATNGARAAAGLRSAGQRT